jgi:tRNA(adenine34) deaminase
MDAASHTDRSIDRQMMLRALDRARDAAVAGDVPVGAVLARAEVVLAESGNASKQRRDPTAHAEIEVLRAGGAARQPGATLYVSLEPCLMCLGAMVHARIGRLVFGAYDPKVGATELLSSIPVGFRGLNHQFVIEAGHMAEESAALLRAYFRARR